MKFRGKRLFGFCSLETGNLLPAPGDENLLSVFGLFDEQADVTSCFFDADDGHGELH